jgi:polyhydroxyalkanoate synthesis regulator phasin
VEQSEEPSVYELMLELDRLEELREDLEDRGLRTIEDVERRIEELNRQIDQLEERERRGD